MANGFFFGFECNKRSLRVEKERKGQAATEVYESNFSWLPEYAFGNKAPPFPC
jgi:hypothetical protein